MIKNLVEQLKFAANDEHGTYVEALLIKISGGERYVLHRAKPDHTNTVYVHEKIAFTNKEELLKAFPYAIGRRWELTDICCGFEIQSKEFEDAGRRRLDKELKRVPGKK